VKVRVGARTLALTNLDRVLWPSTGTTKAELIDYYARIAPAIVPHLAGRPLMIWRWPEGVHRPGWDQFECRGRPEWMASYRLEMRKGEIATTCVINDAASLVWIANQGTVELHPFLARSDAFQRPSAVVFDLDPCPPAGAVASCRVALLLREILGALSLASFPKMSGRAGMHVYVPLNSDVGYAATKAFARAAARLLAREHPDLIVDRMSRSLRWGKVFIDWSQNDERKQTIAAYSLRATERPFVSAPVTWDEVARAARRSDASALVFSPADVLERWRTLGDPFAPVETLRQSLPAARSVAA
jgi:bifunctional non-homologous end joining protein LigD